MKDYPPIYDNMNENNKNSVQIKPQRFVIEGISNINKLTDDSMIDIKKGKNKGKTSSCENSHTTESIFTNIKGKIEVIPQKKKKIHRKTSENLIKKGMQRLVKGIQPTQKVIFKYFNF